VDKRQEWLLFVFNSSSNLSRNVTNQSPREIFIENIKRDFEKWSSKNGIDRLFMYCLFWNRYRAFCCASFNIEMWMYQMIKLICFKKNDLNPLTCNHWLESSRLSWGSEKKTVIKFGYQYDSDNFSFVTIHIGYSLFESAQNFNMRTLCLSCARGGYRLRKYVGLVDKFRTFYKMTW